MGEYIDILLTKEGVYCVAPPWEVKEGWLVSLLDVVSGENKLQEVVSVATDEVGGDFVTMIEKYIGYPLPRITAKYLKSEVVWNEPIHER